MIQGAIRIKEIEKEFYSRRKERSRRSAQSFSIGLGGSQPSKRIACFGQPNQSVRTSVGSGIDSFAFSSPEQRRAG